MKHTTKAHFAVLITNFIFGINYSVVKLITPIYILPLGLNMARVLVAFLLFWGLFLIKPSMNPPIGIKRKDIPRFVICAATGVVLNQIFFIKGLSLTSPIHASLLALITPILIVFIAAWMLKESLSWLKIMGLCLGISGASILIMSKTNTSANNSVLLGDMYVIINAILYSFFMVWVKPLMQEYKPLHVVRWVFTFGFIMLLPFAGKDLYQTNWQLFDGSSWAALTLVCIGATFITYLFNAYGIAVIGSSTTGVYIYTQPFFAALVAIVLMGERITIHKVLAACLIFLGVFIATYKKKNSSLLQNDMDANILPE